MTCRHLIILFLDQLNEAISSLADVDKKKDYVLIIESDDQFTTVPHHKLKISFQISAARQFAQQLKLNHYNVKYAKINDSKNTQVWQEEVARHCALTSPQRIIITEPSEWHHQQAVQSLSSTLTIPVQIREDTRFFATKTEFSEFASSRKQLRMEHFYHQQRKKHDILMKEGKPVGGKWNYDTANRKAMPAGIDIPKTTTFPADKTTQSIIRMVNKRYPTHPGNESTFYFAVTRTDALVLLDEFIKTRLPLFGDYQDAMVHDQPWLFHSHLSFYLNNGLLLPKEVVGLAEKAYQRGQVPLNAAEGFIRQILGWREYIRGIYWLKMPQYHSENHLKATRPLPEFYWTAKTKMSCLSQCIGDTLSNAYAHHIQRLMVLGNFALLIECDPIAVQRWYLAVYADAYEWVELPNVVGMILHADGGFLASKPYISSGNYINKMSNYCNHCHYNVKEKSGDKACPFNYLYWHFLKNQKTKLEANPRLAFPYRTLAKMSKEKLEQIDRDSLRFLDHIDES